MIRCLNCREAFADHETYQRHQWRDHAGELDRGEVYQ